MLDKLSKQQVEKAFLYLSDPLKSLPQELKELNEMEWFLLHRMLQSLLQEKESHPLQ
jgi:hypothetical protein